LNQCFATLINLVVELCAKHQILPHQAIVIGDGANDLEMMAVAGLSVAYYAKPAVLEYADIVISYSSLKLNQCFATLINPQSLSINSV
jgi:phosphoserine phosphatase